MRILIVEDEYLIRECLLRVAQSKGHTVKTEKSGKSALKTWKLFQPHLIFLDILIPEIDGLSLLELVGKKNNEKVVMMSAHRELSQLSTSGVDLFISKPFHNIESVFNEAENLCHSKENISL